jgi:CTP:molybdopterin cytidylyltransferase MocA
MDKLTTFDFPILILAAGQSRRMRGTDKLLEEVEGVPLLRRQARNARAATRGRVIVTLPPAPHPRHDLLGALDIELLPVPDAEEGISASLRSGVAALEGAPALMILLGDLPELTETDLRRVMAAVNLESDTLIWRGATLDGKPGHPIVIRNALYDGFLGLDGDNGGRDILASKRNKMRLVKLAGDRALRDLDTPEDWSEWRAEKAAKQG